MPPSSAAPAGAVVAPGSGLSSAFAAPAGWERGAPWVLAALAVVLATVNLSRYPPISGWDEGMYLEMAVNTARFGEYATRNGEAFERLQPPGGTGPTLILPVAAAMLVGGFELWVARLVIVAALLVALAGGYRLLRTIGGSFAAVTGTLLLLVAGFPDFDTLGLGRQVLAEVPALALLLWGLWFWIRSWDGRTRDLVIASALVSLAIVTKNQWLIFVTPGLAVVTVVGRLYHGALSWRHGAWPIAATVGTYLGWTAVSYLIAGDQWPRYNEALRLLTASTFLNVGLRRSVECLKLFYRSGQWPLVALALMAIPAAGLARSVHGARASVLPLLLAVAVPTGVVFGLPWPRYLYPALVLAALGSGVSLAVLAPRLARRLGSRPIAVGASLAVVALVAAPRLAYHASRLLTADDDSAERLARHLDTGVPAAAMVVNWEWELDFLAERRFHRPPALLFGAMVDQVYNQRHHPVLEQPRLPPDAGYLVVGPFAAQTRAFERDLQAREHREIAVEGPYRLYALAPVAAPRSGR